MTKFNVGDKVVPISKTIDWNTLNRKTNHLDESDIWKRALTNEQAYLYVNSIEESRNIYICSNERGGGGDYFHESDLGFYKPKPTKNQRITALENELVETKNEVAELKLIVHELRGKKTLEPSTTNTVDDIIEFEGQQYCKVDREAREGDVVMFTVNNIHYRSNKSYKVVRDVRFTDEDGKVISVYNKLKRTPENVDVYELIESKPLTPNQQRAAIIEKAKKFVEENNSKIHPGNDERTTIRFIGNITDKLEFVINEEKRTVVALIKGVASGDLYAKGIAKYNPNDVFNEHIGKAIALGRALGLDVSEFEQAVQPTELAVGMIVERFNVVEDEIIEVKMVEGIKIQENPNRVFVESDGDRIINDTNAKYGEES